MAPPVTPGLTDKSTATHQSAGRNLASTARPLASPTLTSRFMAGSSD